MIHDASCMIYDMWHVTLDTRQSDVWHVMCDLILFLPLYTLNSRWPNELFLRKLKPLLRLRSSFACLLSDVLPASNNF